MCAGGGNSFIEPICERKNGGGGGGTDGKRVGVVGTGPGTTNRTESDIS